MVFVTVMESPIPAALASHAAQTRPHTCGPLQMVRTLAHAHSLLTHTVEVLSTLNMMSE